MEEIKSSGISQFFLWAIPAVLALAALWWLAFGEGVHYFRRELSQERRHAIVVGAAKLPTDPFKIRLNQTRDAVLKVTSAEIDGKNVWVYYQNFGQSRVKYIALRWSLISPDGTQIKSGWTYADVEDGAGELDPGEKGECKLHIVSDPRAETLDIRVYGK